MRRPDNSTEVDPNDLYRTAAPLYQNMTPRRQQSGDAGHGRRGRVGQRKGERGRKRVTDSRGLKGPRDVCNGEVRWGRRDRFAAATTQCADYQNQTKPSQTRHLRSPDSNFRWG